MHVSDPTVRTAVVMSTIASFYLFAFLLTCDKNIGWDQIADIVFLNIITAAGIFLYFARDFDKFYRYDRTKGWCPWITDAQHHRHAEQRVGKRTRRRANQARRRAIRRRNRKTAQCMICWEKVPHHQSPRCKECRNQFHLVCMLRWNKSCMMHGVLTTCPACRRCIDSCMPIDDCR